MNQIDLSGRGAVVTGGARGIGYACAERLAASGAKVSLWDMDGAALAEAAKQLGGAHTVTVDITSEASVAAAAKAASEALGKVDILVNNAGITGPNRKTWEFTPEEWRRVIDVDLTGAFLCSRALVPGMMARRYGRIVNMASVAGKEGNPNAAAYSSREGGPDRPHQIARQRARDRERHGQLRDPGRGRDRSFQADDRRAHRLYALEDPDEPFRAAVGDRGASRVAVLGRMRLQHRRRVRHLRRPRDL